MLLFSVRLVVYRLLLLLPHNNSNNKENDERKRAILERNNTWRAFGLPTGDMRRDNVALDNQTRSTVLLNNKRQHERGAPDLI